MISKSAQFSDDRRYRYTLTREWRDGPSVAFCMLNPSTADETANDPTVERCQRRAHMSGFGKLVVVNLFAYRSTDPKVLRLVSNPVGPRNDEAIIGACSAAQLVVCGWGVHGALYGRGAAVLAMLREAKIVPHALRINGDGCPAHPLYIGYETKPQPF